MICECVFADRAKNDVWRFLDIDWHNIGSAHFPQALMSIQGWDIPRGQLNRLHHWLCRSARWRQTIQQRVPWVLDRVDLGSDVLELGPGPGLTTDVLQRSVQRLTAIEIDAGLAEQLRSRLHGSNVEIVTADATEMPFPSNRFSAGVSFTMLHHVPSPALQDKLLREVWRVMKPGGAFAGSDSLQSLFMRMIHVGDTLVPIDPDRFGARLQAAGFEVLEIEKGAGVFRFHARKPA